MTEERKQIAGHVLACGTQIMWGATFVSSKVLLEYFLPSEVLFTRVVLAFLTLLIVYPPSSEAGESQAGGGVCRSQPVWNRALFHAGKYCIEH